MRRLSVDDFLFSTRCHRLFWMDIQEPHSHYPNYLEISPEELTELFRLAALYLSDESLIPQKKIQYPDFDITLDFSRETHSNKGRPSIELLLLKPAFHVRRNHLFEASFYRELLIQQGYLVKDIGILYLNGAYIRKQDLSLSDFFTYEVITPDVVALSSMTQWHITEMLRLKNTPTLPDPFMARHCFKPDPCPYFDQCWSKLPHPSILSLADMPLKEKILHYHQGTVSYATILETLNLSPTQKIQLECESLHQAYQDLPVLQAFSARMQYPLAFLDFEAAQFSIPPFQGLRPFEQLAVQFSVHLQSHSGADLDHHDFIAPPSETLQDLLCTAFLKALPESGSIVVFNASLEVQTLRLWIKLFPEKEGLLQQALDRIVDIAPLFQRFSLYEPGMNGRRSLKSIASVLFKDLFESDLSVPDGKHAALVYSQLQYVSESEWPPIFENLRLYSTRDTLIIAKLIQYIQDLLRSHS